LFAIDLDELRHKPLSARSPRGQPVTDVAEQQRSAGHRADYECERERAERVVAAQDRLIAELENLRSLLDAAQKRARPVTHPPDRA
jgi:hypothetical protein